MNNYQSYSASDLDILMHEPWEVSDQPYMLHAAYALSCLFDTFQTDAEECDDKFSPDDMWGFKIPKKILDRLVIDIESDLMMLHLIINKCVYGENHILSVK